GHATQVRQIECQEAQRNSARHQQVCARRRACVRGQHGTAIIPARSTKKQNGRPRGRPCCMLTPRARLFFVVLFLEEVVVFVFEIFIFEVLVLHQVFFVLGVFFVFDLFCFLVICG